MQLVANFCHCPGHKPRLGALRKCARLGSQLTYNNYNMLWEEGCKWGTWGWPPVCSTGLGRQTLCPCGWGNRPNGIQFQRKRKKWLEMDRLD